ncbi:MAG: phenylalanine--tRNA ligase subunit beta [Bacteroidetes bacterium]|nr:phenylalanine--tRNA ligase subunit beta [Bacteroidota bacterium]
MKISYNWLKEYINIDIEAEKLSEILTSCGLEVEGLEKTESIKGGLKGVVIGQVKKCVKHPDADKLSVTQVDIGHGDLLQIVCGAPNVRENQKVVVATVGTTLHTIKGEQFEIKKAKIRGQESFGMICAEDEIGIGTSHDGIIVLPESAKTGTSAAEYYNVSQDVVFEIGLTPNRVDASSHIGVARDIVAVLNATKNNKNDFLTINKPSLNSFKPDNNSRFIDVIIDDAEACPRYSGITISGVTVKESPEWLQQKLKSIGLKPINNIVDITNFVLHEIGQPLHAFDADKIKGNKVIVKKSPKGTKFITLDEKEIELTGENLMICNTEEPMCMAGVLGGLKSGVTEETKNIFLESAYFQAASIRKSSKHHDIKTDASFRFERGTDPHITVFALKRAAMLIKEIAGGIISSEVVDRYPKEIICNTVSLSYKNADSLIGKKIDRNIIKNILESLEIKILSENEQGLSLEIPAFKVDVFREADVIEEILRIYGYNNVEIPDKFTSSIVLSPKPDKELLQNAISDMLCSKGFVEIMNNSLTKIEYYKNEGLETAVKMLNPLSQDLNVLRQDLLYGGLEVIAYNQNRKVNDLKIFEFGNVYSLKNNTSQDNQGLSKYKEKTLLSLFLTGDQKPESWYSGSVKADFFELKGYAVSILSRLGIYERNIKTEEIINDSSFSNGLTFFINEKQIAKAGYVNKSFLKRFDIKGDVYYAVFEWDNLVKLAGKTQVLYKEISKFPEVRRDLALIIDKSVNFAQIEALAYKTEKKLLKKVGLFDVYQDDNKIGKDKKSYAVSFILQDESKTLTDKEIDKAMDNLLKNFQSELGASIR